MPSFGNLKSNSTSGIAPLNLEEAVFDFDERLRTGRLENYRPAPLGFPLIDECLGGGMHNDDLVLVGGVQNVGKTIVGLQAAKHMAQTGQILPIVVCYEHSTDTLLHRLICQESVDNPDLPAPVGVTRAEIESAVIERYDQIQRGEISLAKDETAIDLGWLFERLPLAERAWNRMSIYLRNLWLVRGDGLYTTVKELELYLQMARAMSSGNGKTLPRRIVLIVDYAQRVAVRSIEYSGIELSESQRIDLVMRGLMAIALKTGVPVLAVAAADAEGLRHQRIHVENLWGPSTVQYEPDTVLILNRDSMDSATGQKTVRLAIEKNRSGPSEIEFRHWLHGKYYCLSPRGERVADDESFQVERIALRAKQQNARPGIDPMTALLLLAAVEKLGASHGGPVNGNDGTAPQWTDIIRRALSSDDGGASLMDELAGRFGIEDLVSSTDGRKGDPR